MLVKILDDREKGKVLPDGLALPFSGKSQNTNFIK
jgi:hypothetical protein